MSIFGRFRKRGAIKAYVKKLPGLLVKDYGRLSRYTPLQVRRTIERAGLDITYSCYAIAMFSGREDFLQFHNDAWESCDYDAMGFSALDDGFAHGEHGSGGSHGGSHESGGGNGHGDH